MLLSEVETCRLALTLGLSVSFRAYDNKDKETSVLSPYEPNKYPDDLAAQIHPTSTATYGAPKSYEVEALSKTGQAYLDILTEKRARK
jgi:hypothetical protein